MSGNAPIDDEDDRDQSEDRGDRTQRLVAELAEVRRRMSSRAMPPVRQPGESTGPRAPVSAVEALAALGSNPPPRPALQRVATQRVVVEEAPTPTPPSTPPTPSRRAQK